jgi:hypothetical protein
VFTRADSTLELLKFWFHKCRASEIDHRCIQMNTKYFQDKMVSHNSFSYNIDMRNWGKQTHYPCAAEARNLHIPYCYKAKIHSLLSKHLTFSPNAYKSFFKQLFFLAVVGYWNTWCKILTHFSWRELKLINLSCNQESINVTQCIFIAIMGHFFIYL